MKKIKRFLSILLSVVLMLIISMLCIPASAESNTENLSVENTITFNSRSYNDLSREELFAQKLDAAGISEDYYELLSQKMFDDICDAQTISTKSSYYVETSDGSSMIQTTKNSYNKAVKAEKEKIAQNNANIKTAIQGRSAGELDFSEGSTATINNGTLNIVMLLVSSDNSNFVCSAIFQWETMPSARHTDAFGLTRDSHTLVDEHSVEGLYTTSYTISGYSGTDYEITEYHDTTEFAFNDFETSSNGYAYEIELKNDVASSEYPYTAVTYTEMMGMILYDGFIDNESTTGANHWATYAHQKLNLAINGINFSVPFATGFDVTWSWTYEQLYDEHTWRRL